MILQILSAAYSGSTLLDAMLDSQAGIHGFGECAQVWEAKPPGVTYRGPCHLCGTDARQCEFWADYFTPENEGTCPATYALNRMPVDSIVVDSSKAGYRFHEWPGFPTRQLMLFKAPHEWVASVLGHHAEIFTPERAWEAWIGLHEQMLGWLDQKRAADPARIPPLIIPYRKLTAAPALFLWSICSWLGYVDADAAPISDGRMWNRKSHALGGNPAVIDQLAQNETQTGGRAKWMGGKYAGESRWRSIGYDDAWKKDVVLRRECARFYRTASRGMEEILQRLSLPPASALSTLVAP